MNEASKAMIYIIYNLQAKVYAQFADKIFLR